MFTFVDLFAGIGGFRIALESLGGKCLGFSEVDKKAIEVYKNNFSTLGEVEFGDIKNIAQIPANLDFLVGGVPCQPWSIAGKRNGINDPRGKLWIDVIRLVEQGLPKAFIFENVPGLLLHKESFNSIIKSFVDIGYIVSYETLNSSSFGLPQDRERVFIVGIRNDASKKNLFSFPPPLKHSQTLLNILNINLPDNYTSQSFNDFFIFSDLRNGHTTVHSWDLIQVTIREKLILHTILSNRRKKKYGLKDGNHLSYWHLKEIIPDLKMMELLNLCRKKILKITGNNFYDFHNSKNMTGINGVYRIILPTAKTFPTLTATQNNDFIATTVIQGDTEEDYKINFLEEIYFKKNYIPVSAEIAKKLQGFPDWFIPHNNENVAKKQFGNAISVPVVAAIAKQLIKILDDDRE